MTNESGLIDFPRLRKAKILLGQSMVFHDATESDAAFILSLRTDSVKSRHLSVTSADIESQKAWLRCYASAETQAYFIIKNKSGESLGTVRLYDPQGESFCWGSWILAANAPTIAAIESALMVYAYAVSYLGFRAAHFDVRKGNKSVWQFHERFGAARLSETEVDYFYSISLDEIEKSIKRYKKYLPDGVRPTW